MDITYEDFRHFNANIDLRVLTPGSNAGEFVHLLSALERPSERWQSDREWAQQSLRDAISLLSVWSVATPMQRAVVNTCCPCWLNGGCRRSNPPLLDEVLSWVRSLTGTHQLRALVVIDEVSNAHWRIASGLGRAVTLTRVPPCKVALALACGDVFGALRATAARRSRIRGNVLEPFNIESGLRARRSSTLGLSRCALPG